MSTNNISIGGKAFKPEPDGAFIVSRRQLRGQDLRVLPPNTTIAVSDFRGHRSDPIKITSIQILTGPAFEVQFDYWQCPSCWAHALEYSKFMDATKELLMQAVSTGIVYEDTIHADDGIHHFLHMIRSEYDVDAIEVGVETDVDSLLAQLMQFTIQLGKQVKQQFNV